MLLPFVFLSLLKLGSIAWLIMIVVKLSHKIESLENNHKRVAEEALSKVLDKLDWMGGDNG